MLNNERQAGTNAQQSTEAELTTSALLPANQMLAAGLYYGQNMTVEKAQDAAVCDGRKIRHRLFDSHEYIFWSEKKWFTEDGYELPNDYWRNKNEFFQIGWSVL